MARPIELNDELTLRLADALEEGCSIADACALCGISESTYHDWQSRAAAGEERFLEFSELTRAARAEGRRRHVRNIVRAAVKDWRASAFYLERSDPANWGRKDALKADLTTDGQPLKVQIYLPDNGRDGASDPHDPAEQPAPGDVSSQ